MNHCHTAHKYKASALRHSLLSNICTISRAAIDHGFPDRTMLLAAAHPRHNGLADQKGACRHTPPPASKPQY